jgi:type I restriction-modification system DNA methylase subunit
MCTLLTVQQRARVTAADIGRLAGVQRAAVSNWRKRYESFPAPVGGTAASPQFDLDQIERWLVDQGKLPGVAVEDRLWRNVLAATDDPAEGLAAVGDHLSGDSPLPYEALRPELDALIAKTGSRGAFAELWRRFADLPGQRAVTTPDALADLMATLVRAEGGTVLDPACGTGALLRAATNSGATQVFGQDNDAAAARLSALWLRVHELPGEIRIEDSLRHDAFPELAADAVVANLPFGLTNWGHEELGYDRRWEFGVPPRTESELAWVQHAIAHLRPGGLAALLMPPSAASRRAGRRIRAELLRRGVIRAIIALPPGAAAPHGFGLHIWVLQRTAVVAPNLLFVDVAAMDLPAAYRRTAVALATFLDGTEATGENAYAVPVIDLLDEEVDLTPGRYAPAHDTDLGLALRESGQRLDALVRRLPALVPVSVSEVVSAGSPPMVSVADLVRSGAVEVLGPVRGAEPSQAVEALVLTVQDIVAGRPASGVEERPVQVISVRAGDVAVPVLTPQLTARVITEGGSVLGRNVVLLRADPSVVDSWFLAGHLRTAANERQASSLSGTSRIDVRKAQVPRVPLGEQQRHGQVFRRLHELNETMREAVAVGAEVTRLTAEGLAGGRLHPGRG